MTGMSLSSFCAMHNLSKVTFSRAFSNYKVWKNDGIDNFRAGPGRPRLLDETAELNLIDTIERRHLANDAVRTSDFMAVYASAATEYYARLGVGKTVFTVSKRTLN